MGGDSGNGAAAAVRLAEGAALREVMDTADPAAWTALDAGVREAAWSTDGYQWLPAWEAEAGRALAEALTGDSGARPLTEGWLALGLCHRQGRIRAAALEQAAARPELLPLMVVRCSDWAPPVRERARRLLVERLDAESAVRLMTLILRVGRRGRGGLRHRSGHPPAARRAPGDIRAAVHRPRPDHPAVRLPLGRRGGVPVPSRTRPRRRPGDRHGHPVPVRGRGPRGARAAGRGRAGRPRPRRRTRTAARCPRGAAPGRWGHRVAAGRAECGGGRLSRRPGRGGAGLCPVCPAAGWRRSARLVPGALREG
ncbi:hypothetical protein M2164_006172 [Streptomyces sp. SAI-208]|nr:hypothetical protein [Streptomyces sp. SAI-208]